MDSAKGAATTNDADCPSRVAATTQRDWLRRPQAGARSILHHATLGHLILIHLLEPYQLLENVLQDILGAPVLPQLRRHPQDLASLLDVEIEILVFALVGELRQSAAFGGELLIEVEEIQVRLRRFPEAGR